MTWADGITPEEKECVAELKRRLIQECTPKMLEDPSLFYRFSKARNFNLKQAEFMLRKNIAWRKEHNADNIMANYKMPEVLKKYVSNNFLCFDKEGHPVRFVSVGKADVPGVLKSVKKGDLLKYNLYILESDIELLQQQSQKLGKLLTNVVYIYDFEGFSLANATNKEGIKVMMEFVGLYQDNYPERLKTIYTINASLYFTMTYSIIKPILAEAVVSKVKLFGSDGWKDALLENIDADVLPAFLGGKKTDPDGNPLCQTYIVFGGKVPEKYYLKKSSRTLHREPGVQKIKITRFCSSEVELDVGEPGSLLEWEFETKCKDIGFGLYFKDKEWNEEKSVELVPKQRVDTWVEPESGMYKCERKGSYVVVFDNSYSWFHTKEIFYRIKIIPPDQQKGI